MIGPHADAPTLQFPTYTYLSWREASEAVMRGELGTMNGADDTVASWYGALFTPQDMRGLVDTRYGARSLVDEIAVYAREVTTEHGMHPDK